MPDLTAFSARICYTVAGILIHQHKVLLVKHRKLGFWLNPGGHIEPGETPVQAVEREFAEETGVAVRALSQTELLTGHETQYLPAPFQVNLHWVSRENYESRQNKAPTTAAGQTWSRGCEQHLNFLYLVQPRTASVETKFNQRETAEIAWFTEAEIPALETTADIRQEIQLAFNLKR